MEFNNKLLSIKTLHLKSTNLESEMFTIRKLEDDIVLGRYKMEQILIA